uniref:TAT-variant-translocated molybdopterin oxidoreductase n=1 Tax=Roseihalotalea indica TaxID=2867963 RepID=A0AA49GRC5_9BACT|nr:TAT-variant-translocated molybdopterin oxidoreductase [Tunicatimonas sp. TK19036]
MKQSKKRYWKGLEELRNDPEFVKNADKEFPEYLPLDDRKGGDSSLGSNTRRDFLKMMGFGISAATLAACEAPVRKAIPYVVKPVDVDPSIPNYYASSYIDGGDYCSIVVKTREGRPIKIEGNNRSTVTMGGTNAQVQASVLSLYDKQRLQGPVMNGEPTSWSELDNSIRQGLRRGGRMALVSYTVLSPTTQKAIDELVAAYPGLEHVQYDPISADGMLEANRASFGQAVLPSYDFSKANVIVSFGADFLGTWIAPIIYSRQYAQTRKLNQGKKTMSRHYQFESALSLSGANADYRSQIKPSQEGIAVAQLYNLVAAKAGGSSVNAPEGGDIKFLEKAAADLLQARGKSLVVSGSNDPAVQGMVNAINNLLGNYGQTLDISRPAYYRKGNNQAMERMAQSLEQGQLKGVIFYNCNPVYDFYQGEMIGRTIVNADISISTSDRMDETAAQVTHIAPDHHYLESWNDAQPQAGQLSLVQPAITPIFDTRQAQSSFLTWANSSETDYYTYLRNNWRTTAFAAQSEAANFDIFWDQALYDGTLETSGGAEGSVSATSFAGNTNSFAASIRENYQPNSEGLELVLYQKVGLGAGRQANNPWLQEMPDPISKACWDNYVAIPQSMAREMDVTMSEGKTKMAQVTVGDKTLVLPVLVQPGQASGTISIALGYGRTKAGKVANGVGVDVNSLIPKVNGHAAYYVQDVQIEILGDSYRIAQTQTHQTFMGRETVIQDAVLSEYQENPKAGRYEPHIETYSGPKDPDEISLWKGHKYPNHHWVMGIDLNSCIGCGACTVACQVENNVPVVGRQEVINRRDMHWIRIDRYYSSDAVEDVKEMEKASDNPEVTFQPMLCQQCNNAPCETVCPVAATTHSSEGLNQMTYNRCIGTRYCANNCPYKVRRFNWFKYHDNKQFSDVNIAMNDDLGKMVLNPDVTVRSRGVMEKCTFCVQRIQLGKLEAKKEGRRPEDGEINTACAESCPTEAIVFGDYNDPNSRISQLVTQEADGRAYNVLHEIGVRPNIWYLTKIRNKDEQEEINA